MKKYKIFIDTKTPVELVASSYSVGEQGALFFWIDPSQPASFVFAPGKWIFFTEVTENVSS